MTQSSLIEIDYGAEANSGVLNGNFEYLDNKIATTATTIGSNIDSLSSQVTTINTNISNGGVVPVGAVFWFAGATVQAGYLLCDGSAVSRSTYASLFSIIGTTYGTGDGSTTFNLPLLTDGRFAQGGTTAGTQVAAGLPQHSHTRGSMEISGTFGTGTINHARTASGSFGVYDWGAFSSSESVDGPGYLYDFYASRTWSGATSAAYYYNNSSGMELPISDTVQPKALILLPCIKY